MPSLRAASVGVLVALVPHSPDQILAAHKKLQSLAVDPWWEVRAQVGVAAATLLARTGPEHPMCGLLLDMVLTATSEPSSLVAECVLSHCGSATHSHDQVSAALVSSLFERFGGSPATLRRLLTADSEALEALPAGAAAIHTCHPLNQSWSPVAVATEVLKQVEKLDNLDLEHLAVLTAVFETAEVSGAEMEKLFSVFLSLKDFAYVALCDDNVCTAAVECLTAAFSALGAKAAQTFSTLLTTVNMMQMPGDRIKLEATAQWILSLHQSGGPLQSEVQKFAFNLAKAPAGQIPDSPLQAVVQLQ
jgi:hypothetical protein